MLIFKHCNDNNLKRKLALITIDEHGDEDITVFSTNELQITSKKTFKIISNENNHQSK